MKSKPQEPRTELGFHDDILLGIMFDPDNQKATARIQTHYFTDEPSQTIENGVSKIAHVGDTVLLSITPNPKATKWIEADIWQSAEQLIHNIYYLPDKGTLVIEMEGGTPTIRGKHTFHTLDYNITKEYVDCPLADRCKEQDMCEDKCHECGSPKYKNSIACRSCQTCAVETKNSLDNE